MRKLSIKNMVVLAVVIGVIAGLGAGLARSAVDNSPVAVADGSSKDSDQGDFSAADWGLTGEHSTEWLLEGALGGFQNLHSGSSNDPDTLRSLLEAAGIEVPEGASTHDMRNLLSGSGGSGGFGGGSFDHSG